MEKMKGFFAFPRRFWIAGVVIVLLGGLSLWYLCRDSEELKITRTLRALCTLASKPEKESAALGAVKISKTDDVFAPSCRFEFKHEMFSGSYTPREITGQLTRYRAFVRWSEASMRDLQILEITPERATAVFTGFLEGATTDGKGISEVRDLFCELVKVEGEWRIDELTVREILEK